MHIYTKVDVLIKISNNTENCIPLTDFSLNNHKGKQTAALEGSIKV